MTAPVTASERDLRTLAGIVSDHRADLPAEGLPPSLLVDLMDQIHCDAVTFFGMDSGRRAYRFGQDIPPSDAAEYDADPAHWEDYWDCKPCSYPDRTHDLRSILKIADFYSAGQWHATSVYCNNYRL